VIFGFDRVWQVSDLPPIMSVYLTGVMRARRHRRRHIEVFDPVEKNSRFPFKYPFNPTQFYRKP